MTLKNEENTLSFGDTNFNQETGAADTPAGTSPFDTPTTASASPNPWDNPNSTTSQNNVYAEYDEPYVSTSTSTITRDISFKEFYQKHCSDSVKKNINGAAITLYVCSAITLLLSFAATALGVDIMAAALDAFLLLGLALGIHIGKSRACAVIVLVYSILNCLYALIATGKMSGYLIIIAGVYATIYTFKARKEYKEYING